MFGGNSGSKWQRGAVYPIGCEFSGMWVLGEGKVTLKGEGACSDLIHFLHSATREIP